MGTVGKKATKARGTAWAYAVELGIPYRKLLGLGGESRLRSMSDDARGLLLKNGKYGTSRTVAIGGLPALGYKSRVPGVVSQAERVA